MRRVLAAVAFGAGDVVLRAAAKMTTQRSSHTLQVGAATFKELDGAPDCYVNHACGAQLPNLAVRLPQDHDTSWAAEFVATRPIAEGEELLLNYCTFEDSMCGQGFACQCGDPQCYGTVRGWNHLTDSQRQAIRHLAMAHLQ